MALFSLLSQALARPRTAWTRRGNGRRSFLAGLALWLAAGAALAQTSVLHPAGGPSEDSVKAAYVLKFLNYVEWPPSAINGPYVIGVANDDAMLAELQRQSAGRSINRREVKVRRIAADEPLGGVQVLFAGGRNERARQAVLQQASGQPVLLVSDAEGALQQGSMINFRLVDQRVRFEVALEPVRRAGLQLNTRLLSVAIAVIKGTEP
jgi:hypothetical protein